MLSGSLKRLVVRWQAFNEIPTPLLTLSNLEYLDLASNGLRSLPSSFATSLPHLRVLSLAYNKIESSNDIASAALPDSLEQLWIDGNSQLPNSDPTVSKLYYENSNHAALIAHIKGKSYKHNEVNESKAVDLRDKIYGLVFGMAVGDAVGLASEFLDRNQTSYTYGTEPLLDYSQFNRDKHRKRWIPGDWTDDR